MLEVSADPASSSHRAELDPGRRVVLHRASGGRSAPTADTLRQMGYANVAHRLVGPDGDPEGADGADVFVPTSNDSDPINADFYVVMH